MKTRLLSILPAAALAAALSFACACNRQNTPAVAPLQQGNATPSPATPSEDLPRDTVVATIGDEKITAAQLDDHLKAQLDQLDESYKKQKFDLRKQGLEQLIMERLVKAEAAKKGMNEEQYLKSEIDDKVPAPSEADVKKLFEENQAQLPPGSTLEQFRSRIVDHLTREPRQQRAKALFDKLKKDAHVTEKLSEPRKQVEAKGPSRGPADAKVTIVEFSDFQCPFCGRAHDTVEEVMKAYAGKVRLVFRNFPLEFHQYAEKAAEAAACANEQGKFWEYYDVLFANQQKLDVPQLKEHAKEVGLDPAKFAECLDSGKEAELIKQDQAAGAKVGVSGTPAFFINGVMLSGAQPFDEFKRVIDDELAAVSG